MIAPPLPFKMRYRVDYSFVPAGCLRPVEYSLVVESDRIPTFNHPKLRRQMAERGAKLLSVQPLPYVSYNNMGNVTQEATA